LVLLGGIVLGGAFSVRSFGLQEVLSLHNVVRLKAWIEGFGPLAPLVFITGYILFVIFFAPGLPITVLGGVAFGPLRGTVYVSIASTIGVAVAFLIARYGARKMVEGWLEESPRLGRIDQAVADHGWRILLITRLVPLFPFNLQNYAYGLTRIGFWSYLLTSWPCMLPGTAAYTLAGGAISQGGGDIQRTMTYLGIAGILLVMVSLLPRWLKYRSRIADELF